MNIDATFWVAVSFFIFLGGLVYLKVPQKISSSLSNKIEEIKKEITEAEALKKEAKNLLSEYDNKITKSQKETKEIINKVKKESENAILEKTKKFHLIMDERKKNTEQKIIQMKENAIKDIKNAAIKISIDSIEQMVKTSVDKKKLENIYTRSLDQAKHALKQTKL